MNLISIFLSSRSLMPIQEPIVRLFNLQLQRQRCSRLQRQRKIFFFISCAVNFHNAGVVSRSRRIGSRVDVRGNRHSLFATSERLPTTSARIWARVNKFGIVGVENFSFFFFFLYGPPQVPRCRRSYGMVRPLDRPRTNSPEMKLLVRTFPPPEFVANSDGASKSSERPVKARL
jgi:hypothetical protein